jgi:type IV secretory pathway VirB10-like protein
MSEANTTPAGPAEAPRPPKEMRLRSNRAPVTRLSRKVLLGLAITTAAGIGGALFLALKPQHESARTELLNTNNRTTPDGLANLPKDYTTLPKSVPQLGPPLPGDLGRPILNAGAPAPGMANAATAAPADPEKQKQVQEAEAGLASRLFASSATGAQAASALPGGAAPGPAPTAATDPKSPPPAAQDHKTAFLNANPDRTTTSPDRIQAPDSPYVLQAGAVIAASLITGLRSDLPGEITAQVTEDVYDSPSGRTLLIPQGARLVGQYDAQVAFGQTRALLVWTRLIMPNGRSIVLERQPGADAQGYAGLADRVDNHWGQLFDAAILSTLLSVGSEAGTSDSENNLAQAIRQGASQSFSQIGEQVVGRSLNVQPTITIRPGFPMRVMVTHDLVLEPYRSLGYTSPR